MVNLARIDEALTRYVRP